MPENKKTQKIAKDFANVAKFCQIWSHWASESTEFLTIIMYRSVQNSCSRKITRFKHDNKSILQI